MREPGQGRHGLAMKFAMTDPRKYSFAVRSVEYPTRTSFQIKAPNLEKSAKIGSYSIGTFWLVIFKLMRIRIQLIILMRIRILRVRFNLMRIRIHNID
jgi:hypothetical protein